MVGAFYSLQGFQNDFVKFCSFYKHKEKGVEVKGEHLPVLRTVTNEREERKL
jgi:hypothetical protein